MAPAILTNGNGESPTKKKSSKKLSSKQNRKKMDPNDDIEQNNKPLRVDFAALKAKLAAEDSFISGLLANIPVQGASIDPEDGSETSEDVGSLTAEGSQSRATNPEELKERLAAKLSQFKGMKELLQVVEHFFSCFVLRAGKKLDFSDKKMKTKLQRKLDRLEKKKLKKKNNKMKSKIAKLAQVTMKAAAGPTPVTASSSLSSPATVKTEIPEPVVQSRPPRPIYNSEGRMVFSKFDFGELTTPDTSSMKKTNLDPKAALHKIKKVKEKVKELEAKGDAEKAKAILEKKAWEGALQRAEGIKVNIICLASLRAISLQTFYSGKRQRRAPCKVDKETGKAEAAKQEKVGRTDRIPRKAEGRPTEKAKGTFAKCKIEVWTC